MIRLLLSMREKVHLFCSDFVIEHTGTKSYFLHSASFCSSIMYLLSILHVGEYHSKATFPW